MAAWSEVNFSKVGRTTRFDAEYYQPKFLRYEAQAERSGGLLSSYITDIIQPTEFLREYVADSEEGAAIFWRAQNVRPGYIDTGNVEHIDAATFLSVPNSHVQEGDVLITRTGANAGDCAVVPRGTQNVAVSSHTLRLIPHSVELGYAIGTFFASNLGREILFRTVSGSSRPQITKEMLSAIRIPDFSGIAHEITSAIRAAYEKRVEANNLYSEAEHLLLHELGLNTLDLAHELSYEHNFSDVAAAGRFDSDYYKPKYIKLIRRLQQKPHTTLGAISVFSGGATPLGADYLKDGIPFLRIQNIGSNYLIMDDVVYIDENINNTLLKRSQLQPGDVLITITGRIGTAAVVPDDMLLGNINQHIVRARLIDKQTDPYFMAAFLNSVAGRLQTERESYGTTREALPYYCLENIIIPTAPKKLQMQVRHNIFEADAARMHAYQLLEDAKWRVEQMILGGESSHVA